MIRSLARRLDAVASALATVLLIAPLLAGSVMFVASSL
jgi:hypothetical protein